MLYLPFYSINDIDTNLGYYSTDIDTNLLNADTPHLHLRSGNNEVTIFYDIAQYEEVDF